VGRCRTGQRTSERRRGSDGGEHGGGQTVRHAARDREGHASPGGACNVAKHQFSKEDAFPHPLTHVDWVRGKVEVTGFAACEGAGGAAAGPTDRFQTEGPGAQQLVRAGCDAPTEWAVTRLSLLRDETTSMAVEKRFPLRRWRRWGSGTNMGESLTAGNEQRAMGELRAQLVLEGDG
jgi:hypothetical protein